VRGIASRVAECHARSPGGGRIGDHAANFILALLLHGAKPDNHARAQEKNTGGPAAWGAPRTTATGRDHAAPVANLPPETQGRSTY
jgi:hypothetical protein